MTAPRPRQAASLGWAMLVLALACGEASDSAHRAHPEEPSARSEQLVAGREMPAAGRFRLIVGKRTLTLLANATARRPLLESLAADLDFELIAPEVGDEPVTTRIENGHLRDALPDLLPDRAYRVDYRYDPSTARHEVARLEVAPIGKLAVTEVADARHAKARHAKARHGSTEARTKSTDASSVKDTSHRKSSKGSQDSPEKRIDWKEIAEALDDADADERIEALRRIEPEGTGEALIKDRLARDPDPRVRLVAAQRFEFAETLTAVEALLEALHDTDQAVVLAAIDGLEFSDDLTVVEDLARMRPHADPEIDEALEDAIEFMIDDN